MLCNPRRPKRSRGNRDVAFLGRRKVRVWSLVVFRFVDVSFLRITCPYHLLIFRAFSVLCIALPTEFGFLRWRSHDETITAPFLIRG